MSCRIINSPITGQEVQSETWSKILQEVNNVELSDKLYGQLASENFRIWFGDWIDPTNDNVSQVRNAIGEPLLLFHSSTKRFSEFKEEFSKEVGFHFGSEVAAVERHFPGGIEKLGIDIKDARADLKTEIDDFTVYPVFLNVRNMIEGVDYLDGDPEYNDLNFSKEEYDTLYYKGRKSFRDELVKLVIAFYNKGTISREQVDAIFNKELKLKDALAADGYWYINRLENKGEKSYVVFDTNNIKSIYNNGQYSLTNNDIYYNLQPNEIDYRLKVINALQKTSRKKYPSGSIQGFYNDLIKQGTPKTQIDILKQYIITNNIQEIDTDDLMMGLLSEISYAIEINITKKSRFNDSYGQRGESYFVYNGWTYEDAGEGAYEGKRYFKVNETDTNNIYVSPEDTVYITKEEYEETKKASNVEIIYDNDSSYSEMTVPGGTNYTNNEIATPQITPSIKGHAQFSTDSGIGWFRADDKMYDYTELDVEGLSASQIEDLINVGQIERNPASKKTRRILEVQSDLFQKGRNSTTLVSNPAKQKEWNYFTSSNGEKYSILYKEENGEIKFRFYDGTSSKLIAKEDLPQDVVDFARKERERLDSLKTNSENKFLQLLNKDNNWVTFFVKSIIQDSAKKGYEKVLFPSGDTAAKIEGHETIKEFIKGREIMIFRLEAKKEQQNNIISKLKPNELYLEFYGQDGSDKKYFNTPEELLDYGTRNSAWTNPNLDAIQNLDSINKEINQFKKEIEDAKAGKLKISSIHKFYEDTIFNILKKQGYSPERIKDEYDNEWYEVNIKNLSSKTIDTILLNLKSLGKYKTIPEIALSNLSKNGFVNKFNPHDIVNEDRWYFNQSMGLDRAQRYYHEYMSLNNLNRDMFKEGITSNGIPYLVPNRSFDLKDAIEENNERIHKEKYEAIVDFLVNKFGIPKNKINYITKKEFAKRFPEQYHENAQSVYTPNGIYFFTNNLTADITAEELLHPFIYTLRELNRPLFDNLLKEAQKNYPKLHQKIQVLYKSQVQSIRDQELVTQALARVFNNVYENEEPRSFFDVIKDFVKWIANYLNEIFSKFGTGKYINIDVTDLHPLTSLEQIAQIINASDTRFDIIFPEGSFYNMSSNPEDFNKVVSTLLTDKRVEAEVDKILVKIPEELKNIKKRLNSPINEIERKELQAVIREIQELEGDDKQELVKAQVKGIVTTAQLFNTLKNELNSINRSDLDDNIKLGYIMSIKKTADSISGFKNLMVELDNELKASLVKQDNPNVQRFYSLLSTAIAAKDTIDSSVVKFAKIPLLNELSKSSEYSYSIPIRAIDKQISDIEEKISKTSSLKEREKLQKEVSSLLKEKKEILKYAPTKENLQKVLESNFKDANQMSYFFESMIANGHPLVNTLQNIVNDIYDTADSNMLNSKNEAQTQRDEFSKASGRGLRDTSKFYEDIADDLVTIPTEIKFKENSEQFDLDDKGNIQFNYIQQNALVQATDNSYITQYLELEMIKDHYFQPYFKDILNNINDSENTKNYKNALDIFNKFKENSSEREFTKEYYDFRAMLDEKVGDKTIRQIVNNAYDRIDELENTRDRSDSSNREENIQAIKMAKIELKKFKSDFNSDGTKKDEDGLRIAKVLRDYSKQRYVIGDDILTEENETKYKFDLDVLEYKKNQYNNEDFNRLKSQIQQTIISPEYFETIANITEDINHLNNLLVEAANNSDIIKYIDRDDIKAQKKDAYKDIRNMVNPYRDDNQIINGITLSNESPALVPKIKELQQYIENLKFNSSKLTSLSPSEANEYNALRKNDDKTVEQQKRFQELSEKRAALKKFKAGNTSLINELNSLFKELAEISTTINTDYYTSMINEQVSLLKNDDEVIESSLQFVGKKSRIDLDGTIYVKEDGRWYVKQKVGKKNKNVFLGNENIASETGHKEMVNLVIANLAKEKLKTTTWWKDNHYIQYIYNKKTGDFSPKERAIYIWEHQTPTNPNFFSVKPTKEYYTYTVKNNYTNPNYDILYKSVPKAISGKFINKKYAKTITDPAKAKFLFYLTNKYLEIQKKYPDSVKMGHILPAVVKTHDENAVDFTNKVLSGDTFKNMIKSNLGKTDEDTSYLIGGSQSNNQTIPIRFISKMDTKYQTKDALASILLFEYHGSLYEALNEKLPIFEASKLLASKVDEIFENKNYLDKVGVFDKVRRFFSNKPKNEEEATQMKKVEKSILSKTVDNLVDTFYYGQRIKPMIIPMGPFGNVDLAKVSNNVLGYAAKSIFVGNIISSINNSISTRLQAIVNSGIKSNLYSLTNLKNGQAKAVKYGYNLLSDFTKLGNKSFIGQVLDHFAFYNESVDKGITEKTSFTWLKNKTNLATSPKQISEFEVLFVQFLTIADTITVKVDGKDEKLSNFEKIYEIKDGKFQIKKGVKFDKQQELEFRNKFQSMARKLAGAYRQTEISNIERNWAGKSAAFMRRYFVAMATNRFKGTHWNFQEMEVQTGYQRETFNNLVKMFKDFQNFGLKHWSEMSNKEKVSFYKTTMEYGTLFILIALLNLAGGDDDKETLKKNSWVHNMTLVALLRAKSEMEQFTVKGTDDLIRIGRSPFMIFNTIGNVWKVISLTYPTVMGWESAYYQQNTGLHKKGDSKLVATFLKLIGYTGATFHPEEYYVNFKNAQNR